jgi:hypothetical protein
MATSTFQPGDWVIYRKSKRSAAPGPRAQQVSPSSKGDNYSYVVDKFWIVAEVLNGSHLKLKTRRGKEHIIPLDDQNLRPLKFWQRWLYRRRFQEVERALKQNGQAVIEKRPSHMAE